MPYYILVAFICLMTFQLSGQESSTPPPPKTDISTKKGDDGSVVVRAETMPVFPGCEDAGDDSAQAACSQTAILSHVMSNVVYPEIAKENGYQGKVFVEFVVNKKGVVEDIKVVRGVHATLDAAAVEGVKTLPVFKPAIQKGVPVKLKYTIPINFTLNDKKKKNKRKNK